MSRAQDPGPSFEDLAKAGVPPRDNSGRSCTIVEEDRGLPDHIEPCTCDSHDGVCVECRFKITVGKRAEYGHARANNTSATEDGVRKDCPHRPSATNPRKSQYWEGYGDE